MAKLVVKRYATALYDLAASEGLVAKYEEEVKVIVAAFQNEPDFETLLLDHKVTTEDKVKVVENIFTDKVSKPIVGLMVLMVNKNRQSEIVEVLKAFLERVKKESGILKAVVTSAIPLKEEQISALKEKLETSTKSKIELETIVDKSIIAGLIVRVGDKVVDASYKGDMQALKKQLSKLRLA